MVKDKTAFYLDPLHSVGYLTRINFRAFSKALEKLTEPHGVTAGQWRILRVLWEEDGITQREISNRVGITEATAVKSLAGLETAELITREVDKSDRRKMITRLTTRAKRLKKKLIPFVVDVNERALKGISRKDVDTARRVLAQTYLNLTED
ncbi:MAG: MarR family transcriptional regulator [Gammaproteobacteria bacterium]|jgi:DNA-binding MarR family transcriptional regulator|nr:MarR family transcriptional regulator [Gammaproteobacteria bacterium]MBT3867076.1 MarR family transcriptional regulator [Gammaproteobacteria bacterium]MBT4379931.1 MarR family transcriptional regulator [Gammaproteobacteria bacterium]MBT4618485.1 MarR family transcriptional regulator [Gammaproteobacteria bacterium]MBT5197524.1 MarR family transcriptional regulator [Gammaproteobacteria bacterium]